MKPQAPRVVLQAPVAGSLVWLSLRNPIEISQAMATDDVGATLRRAEEAAAEGLIAAGFLSYEAAPYFDPALVVHPPGSLPLAWFGIFDSAETLGSLPVAGPQTSHLSWQPALTPEEYGRGIDAIHQLIARGDTYQVNFTLRLTSPFASDPWEYFISLCRGQGSRCCAFVDTGERILCSVSPELFFRLEGERIWSRPMKGTAPRGRTSEEDDRQARWLRTSPKNRAENVMIVDMVRNDLGRIASPETVRVSKLWHLEKYPSLFQLTSTVEARTLAGVEEIFGVLFPCASVTGAPKIRSMEIIRELEAGPRGAYTGAIGLIGPGRRARFNVGIRTVEIDPMAHRAEYGTGSGIVWDSDAQEEWRECRTKTLVLKPSPPEFELLETMLWDPETGFALLDRHLHRLRASAHYFDFSLDLARVAEALGRAVQDVPRQTHRVRLLVAEDGSVRIESSLLETQTRPWRVVLAAGPVASDDAFLYHKTTHRQVYRHHRVLFPQYDDVLLWNEKGEITESTLANVVIVGRGRRLTPPVSCGLLAGTFRAELLARGEVAEGIVRLEDLDAAEEIFLINSVRKWIPADLDSTTITPLVETRPVDTT